MRFSNLILALFMMCTALFTTGCEMSENVPNGYIAKAWEPTGFRAGLLAPGRHECYGRCKLVFMEAGDVNFPVVVNQLLTDRINFNVSMTVTVAPNLTNLSGIDAAFQSVVPGANDTILVKQLWGTYVGPLVDEQARKVIAMYSSDEMVVKTPEIIEQIKAAVITATKGSVLKVKMVTVNNTDYPKSVTDSFEQQRLARNGIEIAKSNAKANEEKVQAELALANVEAQKSLVEAKAVADSNRVIAASITPGYLAYKQFEVLKAAAAGQNNMFLVPYSDRGNISNASIGSASSITDLALNKRLMEATGLVPEKQDKHKK